MNRKGFTLIELLVTIMLLSIIAIISFVSINGAIEQNKIKNCNIIVNNIKAAGKEYISDHRYNDLEPIEDGNKLYVNITAEDLERYLSGDIINPFDKTVITPSSITIKIELNSNYTAKDVAITAPDVLVNCGE